MHVGPTLAGYVNLDGGNKQQTSPICGVFSFQSCSHQQPIQDFNNLTSPLLLLLRFKVQLKSCQGCQGAGVVLFTLG